MNPTIFLYIGGALILITVVVGIILSISGQRSTEEQRLGDYVETEEPVEEKKKRMSGIPVPDWLSKKVEKTSWGDKISKELAQADLKIKPGEYLAITIGSCIVVAILGYLIGTKSYLLAGAGAVAGLYLPKFYINQQKSKRLIKFNDQLGDMLGLMVNGLRAGYSTLQAMESVSKELPPPISDEFRRVVQEVQLGVTTEKALDNLVRRIPSDDLDLVVTAIKVQREVGGNLAEILDTISHTIRERVRLKGEIRVLTAQMKFSGTFLAALPIIVVVLLYVINRTYIMTLVVPENNTPFPCGFVAIGAAILLIVIGYLVMNKFTKIEV